MQYKFSCIYFIAIINFLSSISCAKKSEPETYLIPEGFTGKVNIIFNQKDGNSVKYQEGRRIYEIPGDGILLTQFTTNDGFINREYYYKNEDGILKRLKTFNDDTITVSDNRNKNEVGIFLDGISGVYGNSGEPSSLVYQEFLVASYNNMDSFFTQEYSRTFNKKIEKISGLKQ